MKRTVKTTLSVYTVDISSRRIKGEKNGCAALNVANGAMRSAQANVKTGLVSPALAVSTARVIYMIFLSLTFKF
jgi:hypothetical protein